MNEARILTVLALGLCAAPVFAYDPVYGYDDPPNQESVLTRTGTHEGFFLRIGLYGHPWEDMKTTVAGAGTQNVGTIASIFRLQAGWSVMPRLAVHLSLLDFAYEESKNADDGNLESFAWGPGVSYYMPGNLFATGSLGFSNLFNNGSGLGYRWMAGFGKEFQFWSKVGIGAMVTWQSGWWKDSDTKQEWTSSGFGFQLTTTIN